MNISENAQAVDGGSVYCKELCLSLIIALQVRVEGLVGVELGDVMSSVQLFHYSVLVSEQTLGTVQAVAISAVEELAAVFALEMVPVHGHGPTTELFLLVGVDALSNLATPGRFEPVLAQLILPVAIRMAWLGHVIASKCLLLLSWQAISAYRVRIACLGHVVIVSKCPPGHLPRKVVRFVNLTRDLL